MSRATRKGGKESGLILVGKKVEVETPATNFTPLDCNKPQWKHLRCNGRPGYIGVNSRTRTKWRDLEE